MPGSPFNMAAGHGGKPLHGGRRESSKAAGGLAGTKDALKAGQLADFEGKLHVDLIKAKNLVKADLMGKSDPYAVLKFGKQKEKTNTIKNTLEPQWDFSTDFKVPDGNSDTLLVEVFDSDNLLCKESSQVLIKILIHKLLYTKIDSTSLTAMKIFCIFLK